MSTSPATSYDAVRYPGRFYPQATPDRIASIARMYGLNPVPVETARVLELACGEGANLNVVGHALPNCHLYGVDLSHSAIEKARAIAHELGVVNASFAAMDLTEFPADAGEFDYIIAHGLYSWVPDHIRAKILEICGRHLAADGLAYISYNAMPGGLLRQYARDLMLFHTKSFTDPEQIVREARGVVNFVNAAISDNNVAEAVLDAKTIAEFEDSFLFHDLLVPEMEAYYLSTFVQRVGAAGLQYVGDANPKLMLLPELPEAVTAQLESISDRIAREQYLDFILCRRFRTSILCRAVRDVELRFTPERMRPFYVSGGTFPAAPIDDLHNGQEVQFLVPNATAVKVNEAVPKALFCALGEAWPKSFRFDELKQLVFERAGEPLTEENEQRFAIVVGRCFARGLLYLRSFEPRLCSAPSERPRASDVARLWVQQATHVPSLTLSVWEIEEPELRELLGLLDGRHDTQQLAEELSRRTGQPFTEEQVHQAITKLAGFGILVS